MRYLDEGALKEMTTSIIGNRIEILDVTSSTNTEIKERAQDGADEGLVVIARRQTDGRGRLDRTFGSPPGGLYLSFLLRPELPPEKVSTLPLIAGLSVSKAISTTTHVRSELKWPNDVQINGRKVCGILMESAIKGEKVEYVIVGIGINVNSLPEDLPSSIKESATTLKFILGSEVEMEVLLRDLLCFLDHHYQIFLNGGCESLLDQWSERSSTLGKNVNITTLSGKITGKALALDQTGALMVRSGGELIRIDFGDCQHLD